MVSFKKYLASDSIGARFDKYMRFLANYSNLDVLITVFFLFETMRKLSKARLKPNKTSRKKITFLRKKLNSKAKVSKSLLRINFLPQVYT